MMDNKVLFYNEFQLIEISLAFKYGMLFEGGKCKGPSLNIFWNIAETVGLNNSMRYGALVPLLFYYRN